jgi:hypothetical protein
MMLLRPGPVAGKPPGHVAYCMLTFVIRNGLSALLKGDATYAQYVSRLVAAWSLSGCESEVVKQFAARWAAWVKQGQRLAAVQAGQYLSVAEEFVDAYLRGDVAPAGGSFFGAVVMLGFDSAFVGEVAAAVGAARTRRVDGSLKYWSGLPEDGVVLPLDPFSGKVSHPCCLPVCPKRCVVIAHAHSRAPIHVDCIVRNVCWG